MCEEHKRQRVYRRLSPNVRLITHLQHIDLSNMLIKHMQKRCLMHRLFLIYSWVEASSQTLWVAQVSDILYLSLSISADLLLPVNKVEIVEKRTHLRNDIRSFCQITKHYKRVYCGGVYHLCKSSSHRSVSPGLS